MIIVIHVLVIWRLDYYNILYMGLPMKIVQKMQLVENAAACVVMGSQ